MLVYYSAKISRHRQNGLSFVPKKILTWVPREAKGEVSQQQQVKDQQPYYTLSTQVFVTFRFPCQAMLKTISAHRPCGPKPG